MRKPVLVAAGIASAAVLAVAGIASANAATGSRAETTIRQNAVTTAISQSDAERIAAAAVPGGTVTETRLDNDNGRITWNVHLSTPSGAVEVKVDAQTGQARIDDGDDASGAGSNTGRADDGRGDDVTDDRGRGGDDGPGHDAGDDRGRGGDDGPGHD